MSPCSFIHLYWTAFKRFTLRKIVFYSSSRYISLYYFLVAINHSVLRPLHVFNHRFGLRHCKQLWYPQFFVTYTVAMIREQHNTPQQTILWVKSWKFQKITLDYPFNMCQSAFDISESFKTFDDREYLW